MSFSSIEANAKAIAMVNTALQSGAITLKGTQGAGEVSHAENAAALDAAYLSKLLTDLSAGVQKLK